MNKLADLYILALELELCGECTIAVYVEIAELEKELQLDKRAA